MSLDVVVGGLYGSEAKGHATQVLVKQRLTEHWTVLNMRTGGPNAGHTGHDETGQPWALRQVPVGVVCDVEDGRWLDLAIAAGSEIDPPVLLDEIDRLTAAGLLGGDSRTTLRVHPEATVIQDLHKHEEISLVGRVGSTGKGIGAARAARIMRTAKRVTDDVELLGALQARGVIVHPIDPREWGSVILEGTQGYALGLHAGVYPQCTSSDCTAVDFLSMAGISPWSAAYGGLTVWVVARVFPIRVAGNSGPMRNETTWEDLGLAPEHTTVTKKQRRVGLPDWDLVRNALVANGADGSTRVQIALSMVDQAHPIVAGVPWSASDERWTEAEDSIRIIEEWTGAIVGMVMSGPNTAAFRHQPGRGEQS